MSKVLHRTKPTSHLDGGSSWSNIELAYDGNIETAAIASMPAGAYSSQLCLYHNLIPCKYISVAAKPAGTLKLFAHYTPTIGSQPRWETVVSSASYSSVEVGYFPIGGSIPTVAMVDSMIIQLLRGTGGHASYLLLDIAFVEEREETTKLDIIKRVARNLRDLAFDGKVTTATNQPTYSELTCDEFAFKHDSALEGAKLWIPEPYATLEIPFGLKNGTEYLIRTYATIDKKIYSVPVFTDVPAANNSFLIFKKHTKEEYDNAFAQAFHRVKLHALEDVDASAAVASNAYYYDVLGEMDYVHSVEVFATGATIPTPVPTWSVDNGQLRLPTIFDPSAYPTIRAIGQKYPALPTLDTATLGIDNLEDFVVQRMTEYLAMRNVFGADKDYLNIASVAQNTADILEHYLVPRFKPNSVKVR